MTWTETESDPLPTDLPGAPEVSYFKLLEFFAKNNKVVRLIPTKVIFVTCFAYSEMASYFLDLTQVLQSEVCCISELWLKQLMETCLCVVALVH